MGSSDDPNSTERTIDGSVGGLVWVRRRNGSWWPGRIMGLDEVSSEGGADLVSPRSGTPVKLLGREDASVDWYNLEKSKRVKAFRCGEYDECIEKARAAAANGNKKAVKYARREDAIIHALEIENARIGKGCVDFSKIDNEHAKSAKESQSVSLSEKEDEDLTDGRSDPGDDADSDKSLESESASRSDSAPELSHSGMSLEESNHAGASKEHSLQGKRRRTPNDSEDDGTEGIKRMRGLEDLGMGVGDSNAGNGVSNGSPMNLSRSYNNNAMKRKRTQVAYVHELLKRKNRQRPLTKVLESTAMVSVPVVCDQLPSSNGSSRHGLSDSKVAMVESTESGKNVTVIINNNSESTGVSCENGASVNPSYSPCDASHSNGKLKKENDVAANLELVQNENPDKLFDVPFVGEEKQAAGFSPVLATSCSGRHQVGQGRQVSQSGQAEDMSLKNEGLVEPASISSATAHVNNGSQRIEKGTSKWQLKGKRKSRHKSDNRKHASRKYMNTDDEGNAYLAGVGHKVNCDGSRKPLGSYNRNFRGKSKSFAEDPNDGIWEWSKSPSQKESHSTGPVAELSVPQRSLPYRQSRFMVNSRYQTSEFLGKNFGSYSKVYDVKLEVKANYRPQHVPLVSLTSKLNGKAIVGRPLTVEILDDGYCDDIIGDECEASHATVVGNADMGFAAVQNAVNGRATAKHMVVQPRSSPSKSPKLNKGGLLSKKIRKLSSLTGHREENRKPVVEKPKGPVIACIPLKLVFSRINEGVNGSARQSHRALSSSNS